MLEREKMTKKNSETIFLIIATFCLVVLVFFMPINKAPDESNHARMAWAITHQTNKDSIKWMDLVGEKTSKNKMTKQHLQSIYLDKIDLSKEKFEWNITPSNIVHMPQLIGMWMGSVFYPSIGVMFTLARLFNALVYILGIYFIIRKAKFAKLPIVFISLTPIMLQQAASLSYDVINYLAILFFFAILTTFIDKKIVTIKDLFILFLSVGILYLTKKNNILLIGFIPFFIKGFSNARVNNIYCKCIRLIKRFRIPVISFILLFSVLISFIALHAKGGFFHFLLIMLNSLIDNNINGDLNSILGVGILGNLGLLQIQLPVWLLFVDFIFLFLLMYIEKEAVSIPPVIGNISVILYMLQVLSIVGGMYFAWTPIVLGPNANHSVGAQGRYFTPFLIYLYFFVVSRKDFIKMKMEKDTYFRKTLILLIVLNFLIMVYLILCFYYLPQEPQVYFLDLKNKLIN